MKVQILPGPQAERGKRIYVHSSPSGLYYSNRNKVIKDAPDPADSEIISLQNLSVSCMRVYDKYLYAGDRSGIVIRHSLKSGAQEVYKILDGGVQDLLLFNKLLVVIGGDQKCQGKVVDFDRLEEGEPTLVTKMTTLIKPLICALPIDESNFAVAGENGTIDFFDATFKLVKSVQVASSFINTLAFDHRTNSVFFGTFDRTFGSISAETYQKEFFEKDVFKGGIYAVDITPDHEFVFICSSDYHLRIYSILEKKIIHAYPLTDFLVGKDFSLGMKIHQGLIHVFTLCGNHFVMDYKQLISGKPFQPFINALHRSPIIYMEHLDIGYISVSVEGKVVHDGELILNHPKELTSAAACSDHIVVSSYGKGFIYNIGSKKPEVENFDFGMSKILHTNGKIITLVSEQAITSFNYSNSKVVKDKQHKFPETCTVARIENDTVFCGFKNGSVQAFDLFQKQLFDITIEKEGKVTAISNIHDDLIIFGTAIGILYIFNVKTKEKKCEIHALSSAPRSLSIVNDLIYAVGFEKSLIISSIEKHRVVGEVNTMANWITTLEAGENGEVYAADEIGGIHVIENKN